MMLLTECNAEDNDTSEFENTLSLSTDPSYQNGLLNWPIMLLCMSDVLTSWAIFFAIWFYHQTLLRNSHGAGLSFIKTRSAGDGGLERALRKGPVTQRNKWGVPEGPDMNLKITWSVHFKSELIFNITTIGNCCTSDTAGSLSAVAPVLKLQENSYPRPKGKSLSIKLEADLWSIKPPSMCSQCELKLKLISPARPIFFCSATKCRGFIIQTSQGFV